MPTIEIIKADTTVNLEINFKNCILESMINMATNKKNPYRNDKKILKIYKSLKA